MTDHAQTPLHLWTDEVRVMVRPFRSYALVAEERAAAQGRWRWLSGPLKWWLILAATVSWTTAGRLVWVQFPLVLLSWSFLPALQIAWLAAVARVARSERPLGEVLDLYYLGHGPWLFLLVLLSGICLFAPEVWPVYAWLLDSRVLAALLVLATLWCGVLSLALFRSALGMPWGRALLSTASFYLGWGGSLVGYFLLTDQLQPLLGITR